MIVVETWAVVGTDAVDELDVEAVVDVLVDETEVTPPDEVVVAPAPQATAHSATKITRAPIAARRTGRATS